MIFFNRCQFANIRGDYIRYIKEVFNVSYFLIFWIYFLRGIYVKFLGRGWVAVPGH